MPDGFNAVDVTEDQGFIASKSTYHAGYNYVIAVKFDIEGNVLWADTTGNNKTYMAACVSTANDIVCIGGSDYITVGKGRAAGNSIKPWNILMTLL